MTNARTTGPDLRQIDWNRQPGLYVTVHRSGLASTATGISARCHLLTVNGVITAEDQVPAVRPLPSSCQAYQPSEEALPVWLYQDLGQVFLIPAHRTSAGAPDVAGWRFGGNFAYREDLRFHELAGFDAAVKIYDHATF